MTKTLSLYKHTKDILEEAMLCCFLSTVLQKEVIWKDQIRKFPQHVFGLAALFVFHELVIFFFSQHVLAVLLLALE